MHHLHGKAIPAWLHYTQACP